MVGFIAQRIQCTTTVSQRPGSRHAMMLCTIFILCEVLEHSLKGGCDKIECVYAPVKP